MIVWPNTLRTVRRHKVLMALLLMIAATTGCDEPASNAASPAPPSPSIAPATETDAAPSDAGTATASGRAAPQDQNNDKQGSQVADTAATGSNRTSSRPVDQAALTGNARGAAATKSAAARRASAARTRRGSSRTRDITFDDIKFDIEKDEPFEREKLTPQIEALHQQRIRIRGYILPSFQQHGITQFVLVRDNQECCFGPGAALYDCIVVEMKPGKAIDYTVRPVAVEGTFSIRELKGPDGKHLAIYHLEGEDVR